MNKFICEFSFMIYLVGIVGMLYINCEIITPKIARSIVFWPIGIMSTILKMITYIIFNLIVLFLLVINIDIRNYKWFRIINDLI